MEAQKNYLAKKKVEVLLHKDLNLFSELCLHLLLALAREVGGALGHAPQGQSSALGCHFLGQLGSCPGNIIIICNLSISEFSSNKRVCHRKWNDHCMYEPVMRIRIRDPVHFYPKDPGSGSGMIFFPDPGSRIPDPYYVLNSIYLQDFTFKNGENRKK
jgi:hypothetical protein